MGAHARHAPERGRSGSRPRRLIRRTLPLLAATALVVVAPPASAQPLTTTTAPILDDLGFEQAWATSTGEGTTVAVLGTPVDPTLPNLLPARDVVDATDPAGAGTNAARLVIEAAPDAQVLPVAVLDDDGLGTSEDLATGIAIAAEAQAGVIALTLSGHPDVDELLGDEVVQQEIRAAVDAGSVVVALGPDDELPDDLPVVLVPDDVSAGDATPSNATALVAGAAALMAVTAATPEEIADVLVDTANGSERTLDAADAVERVASVGAGGGQIPSAEDLEGGVSPGVIGLVVFGAALTAVVGTIWLGSRRPRQRTDPRA